MQSAKELALKNYGRTWTIEMLQVLVGKNKLTAADYVEITQMSAEDLIPSLINIQSQKLNELSQSCEQIIYGGINVQTSIGLEHFSLTLEDQINIQNQVSMVLQGATQVPYHADNTTCRMFNAEEITAIGTIAISFKTYHTTYFNKLKQLVLECITVEEVMNITYGMALPINLDTELIALTGKSSIS